ncbi:hypothetical protein ABMA75_00015 [Halobacteriovorax sp. ZH4_bin.1]|uniref:hypothetical protein n=1 Tax=unclassified Halobacteriovorax TaxID=2639665 RepID=UPI003723C309
MLRLLTLTLVSISTFAICQKWSGPQVIGSLDTSVLNETSGIAISQVHDDRMYNLNDSGSGPEIFWTTISGKNTKKVKVNNFKPYDMEDMSLGPCGDLKCVYIADIGDNRKKRKFLSIVAIDEMKLKADTTEVWPEFVLRFVYPNKEKYDAESMVVHPSGDIYILTKIVDEENRRAMPAKLFKLGKKKVAKAIEKNEKAELEEVATVDLPYHLYNYNLWGRIATAMDISKDGKTLLVLTYGAVFEFNIEFNSLKEFNARKLDAKSDFRIVTTKKLYQQEAIAYGPKDNEFIYTTEVESGDGVSEIVRHVCE